MYAFFYIKQRIYNVRTLYGWIWDQTCRIFYSSYFTYSAKHAHHAPNHAPTCAPYLCPPTNDLPTRATNPFMVQI